MVILEKYLFESRILVFYFIIKITDAIVFHRDNVLPPACEHAANVNRQKRNSSCREFLFFLHYENSLFNSLLIVP